MTRGSKPSVALRRAGRGDWPPSPGSTPRAGGRPIAASIPIPISTRTCRRSAGCSGGKPWARWRIERRSPCLGRRPVYFAQRTRRARRDRAGADLAASSNRPLSKPLRGFFVPLCEPICFLHPGHYGREAWDERCEDLARIAVGCRLRVRRASTGTR
jgi:hypothetical protein